VFCPKCGANNESGVAFCASCGMALVDNQAKKIVITPDSVQKAAKKLPKQIKGIPKIVKGLFVVVMVLAALAIAFFMVGSSVTDPQNVAKGYFEAFANNDWGKMYSYLSFEKSEFINKDSFIKVMTERIKIPGVTNYKITENTNRRESDLTKTYNVAFLIQGASNEQSDNITLLKKSEKKWFFYDDWSVSIDGLVAYNCKITVPVDSIVYLDDKALQTDPTGVAYLPPIFIGQHELRVEHPLCAEYAEKISINGSSNHNITLKLSDSVKSDIAKKTEDVYKEIISFTLERNREGTLNIPCTTNMEWLKEMNTEYLNFAKKIRKEDGTGYKSITLTNFEDVSFQENYSANGLYTCDMQIEYDYVTISKNWYTEELTESPSSYPRNTSIRLTYIYENNDWVLCSFDKLGF